MGRTTRQSSKILKSPTTEEPAPTKTAPTPTSKRKQPPTSEAQVVPSPEAQDSPEQTPSPSPDDDVEELTLLNQLEIEGAAHAHRDKRPRPSTYKEPSPDHEADANPRRRLKWTPLMTQTLLSTLVAQRHLRTETGFPRSVWDSVAQTVLQTADVKPADRPLVTGPKCQGKVENLKRDYDLWKGLGHSEKFTALYEDGSITGTEEDWAEEIKHTPRVALFKKDGLKGTKEMCTVFERVSPRLVPKEVRKCGEDPHARERFRKENPSYQTPMIDKEGEDRRMVDTAASGSIEQSKERRSSFQPATARSVLQEAQNQPQARTVPTTPVQVREFSMGPTEPNPLLRNPLDREAIMRMSTPQPGQAQAAPAPQAQLQLQRTNVPPPQPAPQQNNTPHLHPAPQTEPQPVRQSLGLAPIPRPVITPRPTVTAPPQVIIPVLPPRLPNAVNTIRAAHHMHKQCLSPTGGETIRKAVASVVNRYKNVWPSSVLIRAVNVMEDEVLASTWSALCLNATPEVRDEWLRNKIEEGVGM
ncbi:hypothetical protein BJ508DRAFT_410093 [Ascobolus immersus RN42]|uniref:Myb/SANT-like domain-containing protein n=1 Tax=Ascobolus immersus RN42 TaxID=1160509 RepID=A0A3N4IS42_ASCIM|nr:hypothetical protein BJ508DRAFT_410093 [Ascobolus immersus RN42]